MFTVPVVVVVRLPGLCSALPRSHHYLFVARQRQITNVNSASRRVVRALSPTAMKDFGSATSNPDRPQRLPTRGWRCTTTPDTARTVSLQVRSEAVCVLSVVKLRCVFVRFCVSLWLYCSTIACIAGFRRRGLRPTAARMAAARVVDFTASVCACLKQFERHFRGDLSVNERDSNVIETRLLPGKKQVIEPGYCQFRTGYRNRLSDQVIEGILREG